MLRGINLLKTIMVIVLLLPSLVGVSQEKNLISNGKFQTYKHKPDGSSHLDYFEPWFDPSGGQASPDVFHPKGKGSADLPKNLPKATLEFFNSGIAGILVYSSNASIANYREYLGVKLNYPLIKGETYNLSFHVCNQIPIDSITKKQDRLNFFLKRNTGLQTVDKISVAFYKKKPTQKDRGVLEASCYYNIFFGNNYKKQWGREVFNFIAHDNYKYMVIGNFVDDDSTKVTTHYKEKAQVDQAYYFFDNFFLTKVSKTSYLAESSNCIDKVSTYSQLDISAKDLVKGNSFVLKNLYFEADSSALIPTMFPVLNDLLDLLNEYPTLTIRIEGHTNANCEDIFCGKLSVRRASMIKDYLISKNVKNPNRIKIIGYGKTKIISKNKEKNQRVEVHIE